MFGSIGTGGSFPVASLDHLLIGVHQPVVAYLPVLELQHAGIQSVQVIDFTDAFCLNDAASDDLISPQRLLAVLHSLVERLSPHEQTLPLPSVQ